MNINNNVKDLEIESKKTIDYYSDIKAGLSTFDSMRGSISSKVYDEKTSLGTFTFPTTFYRQLAFFQAHATLSSIEHQKGNFENADQLLERTMSIYIPIRTNSEITVEINPEEYNNTDVKDAPVLTTGFLKIETQDAKYYIIPLKVIAEKGITDYQVRFESLGMDTEKTNELITRYKKLHPEIQWH